MEITPAITELRTGTSCGPKQTFLLFYSRYNGHSRDNEHLTLLFPYSEAKKRHFTFMLQLYVRSLESFGLYFDLYCIIIYHSNC